MEVATGKMTRAAAATGVTVGILLGATLVSSAISGNPPAVDETSTAGLAGRGFDAVRLIIDGTTQPPVLTSEYGFYFDPAGAPPRITVRMLCGAFTSPYRLASGRLFLDGEMTENGAATQIVGNPDADCLHAGDRQYRRMKAFFLDGPTITSGGSTARLRGSSIDLRVREIGPATGSD